MNSCIRSGQSNEILENDERRSSNDIHTFFHGICLRGSTHSAEHVMSAKSAAQSTEEGEHAPSHEGYTTGLASSRH